MPIPENPSAPPEAIAKLIEPTTPSVDSHLSEIALFADERPVPMSAVASALRAEFHAQPAEVSAFALLASRHPSPCTAAYFLELAQVVLAARSRLLDCLEELGTSGEEVAGEPVPTDVHPFIDFMTWLGANAGAAEAACAVRADLLLWCGACSEMAERLGRSEHPVPRCIVDYFAHYATPPPRWVDGCHEVVAENLAKGEDSSTLGRAARIVPSTLTAFWGSAPTPAR